MGFGGNLGDRAFILRGDCSLSISTREFFGYVGRGGSIGNAVDAIV